MLNLRTLIKLQIFVWYAMMLCVETLAKETTYKYVNTTNLILRDRPTENYIVLVILQKPCRVRLVPEDSEYKNNINILKKFKKIAVIYHNSDGNGITYCGWVEKQYLSITPPSSILDTVGDILKTDIHLIPYCGDIENNPNKNNRFLFPYPQYKGGNKVLIQPLTKRKYLIGSRGGCYYLNVKGRKVYVDKKYCNINKK